MNTDWPLFGWVDDIRPALASAMASGQASALATIYRTSGSAPRVAGTQMLFSDGDAVGYFSGSCVEADVATHACATLADGAARHLVYGEGSPWIDIRLACGGRIDILVERVAPDDAAARELIARASQRRPVVWQSDGSERALFDAAGVPFFTQQGTPFRLSRRHDPVTQMVIVGGDPAALAIASLAAQTGYDVHLVRPNGPSANVPITGVTYHRKPADEALADIGIDRWTAVAVATHDLEVDHAALVAAFGSDAFYIGVLGARVRLPERIARLESAGLPPSVLARLRAPIGLEGCGKAPWQVAVSVIAEVMQHANRADR